MASTTSVGDVSWMHLTQRFRQIIDQLQNPSKQQPTLALLLGRRSKDEALRWLFPMNNIGRHKRASTSIALRLDNATLQSQYPVIFADGDPMVEGSMPHDALKLSQPTETYSVSGSDLKHRFLDTVLSRSLFFFTNVICIFANDCGGFDGVKTLLTSWAGLGHEPTPKNYVRPRVMIVTQPDNTLPLSVLDETSFCKLIRGDLSVKRAFGAVTITRLSEDISLSSSTQHLQTRQDFAEILKQARSDRSAASVLFSATHQNALFERSLRHLRQPLEKQFDYIKEARHANPVAHDLDKHFENLLRIAKQHYIPSIAVCSIMASAILMDAYPPGMHSWCPLAFETPRANTLTVFDAEQVFRTLYRASCYFAWRKVYDSADFAEEMCQCIESRLRVLREMLLKSPETTSAHIHQMNMAEGQAWWCKIWTNVTCLSCLLCKPEHPLPCRHSICDKCTQVFARGSLENDSEYVLDSCIVCQLQCCRVIKIKRPTTGIRVLSLDGGGSRGISSIVMLCFLQNLAGEDLPIQSLFDLAVGTSAGMIKRMASRRLRLTSC
jgi:hypothetical protein